MQEHEDAVGAFDLGGLIVNTTMLPDTLLLIGNALSKPLPQHDFPTLCYSLQLYVPPVQWDHYFYIDNILIPPNGIWMFDDGSEYAPSYGWISNSSVNNPDAPATIFMVDVIPCGPPQFTITPNAVESGSHCSDYVFAFQAQDSKCRGARSALRFFSSVGTMDQSTGTFRLTPDSGCSTVAVTASVYNIACMADRFTFTVNWIDVPATLANCPTTTGHIKPNDIYEYPFAATDPDACDKVTFEAVPVQYSPVGGNQIDSTGKFRFAPTSEDSGHTYSFDLTANSGCGLSDGCRFTVEVGASLCGDTNGDEVADISDVVFVISYIFQGGPQPNPLLIGDADCNAIVDISDAVYMVSYIFSGGYLPCAGCP